MLYNPKECRGEKKKKVCPLFLLENSRPLSPWGPLDFLSTCLGIDSLTCPLPTPGGFLFCFVLILFLYLFLFFGFFFNIYILISWRPITLQYCSGSCHTLT